MQKRTVAALGVLLAVAVAFGAGLSAGVSREAGTPAAAQTISVVAGQPQGVDFSQFWNVWSILQQNFVETHASGTIPTEQQQIYGAIEGLTDSYGDPYTVFFPPEEANVFNGDVNGSFGGVGMEMDVDGQGDIIVTSPLKGSPAEAAGIKSGDILTAIDATSTEGMPLDLAVKLIRGPVGAPVTLTLLHQGATDTYTVTIVRQTVNEPIIDEKDLGGGVYEISLYEFSENSADLFRDALRDFEQSGDTKLVLDLRGNPGGYLDAAVDMASYFLPVGDTVVTEDYEGHQDNIVHRSLGYNVFADKKLSMAILVDQDTASAAEILSGALQQHGVAELVGTRTFGKGSVQQVIDLGGGAELKVTVARWLTPNGTNISAGGITPDIQAGTSTPENIDTQYDPTLQAALSWLATQ